MAEESVPPKLGQAALDNMKLLKTESSVFKVPKVPVTKPKKNKTEVLDEDVYVEGIAKIIQRDFFPDLEKLNAQNDYLEAKENKDYARLRELTQKYSGNRPPTEPYNSPATFDTPNIDRSYSPCTPTIRQNSTDVTLGTNKTKTKEITDDHTLDSFLSLHTSEDNASYSRVIALEDRKRASKLAAQLAAERAAAARARAALALPSIEQQADQMQRPLELDTWSYKARNYIMYVPAGAESQKPPPKPELQHHNTRLKEDPFDHATNKNKIKDIAKAQELCVSGKIGVDGSHVSSQSAGYSPVRTPSPVPGAASPLMTWGAIEGTPFRLDGGGTPLPGAGAGAAYRMLEGGARERLALQLAERAARRRRPTTPRLPPASPSFRTNTERLASMSPAARKLAAKHLLSPRLKLTPNNMGITHTATPKRTPTPQRRHLVATPNRRKLTTPTRNTENVASVDNTLTDNLLQINLSKRERLKAKDFFP